MAAGPIWTQLAAEVSNYMASVEPERAVQINRGVRRRSRENRGGLTHLVFQGSPAAVSPDTFAQTVQAEGRPVIVGEHEGTETPIRASHLGGDIRQQLVTLQQAQQAMQTQLATVTTELATVTTDLATTRADLAAVHMERAEEKPWIDASVRTWKLTTGNDALDGSKAILTAGMRKELSNLTNAERAALQGELGREIFRYETYYTMNDGGPLTQDGSIRDRLLSAGEVEFTSTAEAVKLSIFSSTGQEPDWTVPQGLELRKLIRDTVMPFRDQRNEDAHPLACAPDAATAERLLRSLKSWIENSPQETGESKEWRDFALLSIGLALRSIQLEGVFKAELFSQLR